MYYTEEQVAVPTYEGMGHQGAQETSGTGLRSRWSRGKEAVFRFFTDDQDEAMDDMQEGYAMQGESYQSEETFHKDRSNLTFQYNRPQPVFYPSEQDLEESPRVQSNFTVVSLMPTEMADGRSVIRHLKLNHCVILRLAAFAEADRAQCQRLYDYICGAVEALAGSCEDQGGYVYFLTPPTVQYIDTEDNTRVVSRESVVHSGRMGL